VEFFGGNNTWCQHLVKAVRIAPQLTAQHVNGQKRYALQKVGHLNWANKKGLKNDHPKKVTLLKVQIVMVKRHQKG